MGPSADAHRADRRDRADCHHRVYDRPTRLVRDAGQRLELTIVQADSREVIANVLADRRDEQAAVYATLIARLKAAGADCAAITSLGGSFCFAETERIPPLPLVSAVAPLDAYFFRAGLRRVGSRHRGRDAHAPVRQLVRTEAVAFDGDLVALGDVDLDVATSGAATDGSGRPCSRPAGR